MVNLRQDAFVATGVLQSRAARGAFVNRCPITVVLLEAKASQCFIAEEILASVIQIEMRIWVVRMAFNVKGCARCPRGTLRNKFSRGPDHRASGSNNVKTEESIVCHAKAEGATFEKAAQAALLLRFKVVPLGSVFFCESPGVPNGI